MIFCSSKNPVPKPIRLEKFVTKKDCLNIIERTTGFSRSETISSKNKIVYDPMQRMSKTKFTTSMDSSSHAKVIRDVNKYMMDSYGVYKSNMQVTKYDKNDFFKLHTDALKEHQIPLFGEQRLWTVILYLNDDFKGGQTCFPYIQEIYYPRQGDIIMWPNVDENMKIHENLKHKGMTVLDGTKYIAVFLFYNKLTYHKNNEK